MKIINETMKILLFLWLRLSIGQKHQLKGSNITFKTNGTTYEYKAQAQLWVIWIWAPVCPLHTYETNHRNLLRATRDVCRNRVIAFRCMGRIFFKCDKSEKDGGGGEAALGVRDSHMLEWHEGGNRETLLKEVRSWKERKEVSDVQTIFCLWE